jgi:hypothetical protein
VEHSGGAGPIGRFVEARGELRRFDQLPSLVDEGLDEDLRAGHYTWRRRPQGTKFAASSLP